MLDRRRLLLTASSLGVATTAGFANAAPALAGEDARLNTLFDRIVKEQLEESPQAMTSLGLDKGEGAWAASKLDDVSAAAVKRTIAAQKSWIKGLDGIDRAKLSPAWAVNYDTVRYSIAVALEGAEKFTYGISGNPTPYLLSQLSGAYQAGPDFLDSQHRIETRADAEAYLSRLAQFATVLNDETERATADAARGVIPPDFVIDKTLVQMKALRSTPTAQTTLVSSLVRRTKEKNIDGDFGARATALVDGPVWKALDHQIALVESWRGKAVHTAGVARLPDGDAYYRWGAKFYTTTDTGPEEIHKLGLELCASLTAEADALLKSQGMSEGTVGQRMAAMATDPKFIYPNTEEGKTKLLAHLNDLVRAMDKRLPEYFGALPKTGLDIRRVPAAIEAGAPGGYYNGGTLDGTRPGAYYINLRDTAENSSWTLPTLTYHEGLPGHHLQITLALENPNIPMIRKMVGFSGYTEGWALYAEKLADEMGMYRDDPFGKVGYLHDALFRAVRLVVDSGMHAKGWSREQAIKFYVDTIGDPEPAAVTEVERYCVWPGQACSYMIGKITWLRLREEAKAKLGAKFDIRKFHDAGLLTGSMPLSVLERVIHDWEAGQV
jgi:uncharacterized protein (DUF885 family)